MKKIISVLIFLAVFNVFLNANYERISSYESFITVDKDGSMNVSENIEVYAEGVSIKRGIYRDFPLKYRDLRGNNYKAGFSILDIKRNGKNEPYFTKLIGNDIRIYIGKKDYFIPTGYHEYEITYKTDRQLGFFEDFDELYWNVTGNGWSFVIDTVVCIIKLPHEIDMSKIQYDAYTGNVGADEKNFGVEIDYDLNTVKFFSKHKLRAYQGLTVAVGFQKGIIKEPSLIKKTGYIIKDNLDILIGIIGLIILLLYYLFSWAKVGKDPEKGTIIPLYEPPDGLTPGQMRYTMNMFFDNKCVISDIVNLAVKNKLRIEHEKDKFTIIKKDSDDSGLNNLEKDEFKELFHAGDTIKFEQKNHSTISLILNKTMLLLKSKCENIYFMNNTRYFGYGMILTILIFILIYAATEYKSPLGAVISIIFIVSFFITFSVIKGLFDYYKELDTGINVFEFFKNGLIIFVSVPLAAITLILAYFAFFHSGANTPFKPFLNLIFSAIIFLDILFYDLLKAPTIMGRKVMDKIEGFKMFLRTSEKEWMYLYKPPKIDDDLFEKYLPYAIALDAEREWVNLFESALIAASSAGKSSYSPGWYSGGAFSTSYLANSFSSSFTSSVSSSSAAPGSSSGSSGGGSSGGGGGGGGGGGW